MDNIIVDKECQIKLVDFGNSVLFDPEKGITDIEGTILYIAPEVLSQKANYNERSDMWSVGIVAYSMLMGVFPFCLDQDE